MVVRKIMIWVSILALLSGMSLAVAQDTVKNDGIAHVVLITAKDGQSKALEKAIIEYHKYMGTKEGAMRYQWYSMETGKNAGKYLARSGDHNWADFDAKHDWDEEAGAKFDSLVQPHIANMVVTLTRTDDELGNWPENMEGYEYVSVTRWYVMPGQNGAFNEGLKKIDATLKANNFAGHYGFINIVSGGEGNAVSLVLPYKSYADMAPKKPSVMEVLGKAMGEDEAKVFLADWGSTYKSGDNYLLHYMAEQSDYGDGK